MKKAVLLGIGSCVVIGSVVFAGVTLFSGVQRNTCACELAMAVGDEDYARAAYFLQRGAPPDTDVYRFSSHGDCSAQAWSLFFDPPNPSHSPALVYALWPNKIGGTGNTIMARLLLEAGANPDAADWAGNTPLLIASTFGNIEMVRLLLARGADPDAVNGKGLTALDAARSNHHQEICALLTAGKP